MYDRMLDCVLLVTLTPMCYLLFACAVGTDGSTGARLIETDVARTFPTLQLFQQTGVAAESLSEVLRAFAQYRPDIGYVCYALYCDVM